MIRDRIAKISARNRLAFVIFVIPLFTAGCVPKTVKGGSPTALDTYVTEAKRPVSKDSAAEGSLWVNSGRRSDLFRDPKARDVNDILTIRVVESTAASSTAGSSNTRSTSSKTGIDGLFGLEKKIKELPNLISAKADNSFTGKGSTSRVTTVQTNVTARVIDVLPNGNLVVEGVKEIRVNNENQSIHLTGVVRPEDISRDNVVLSSYVAQMTVRLQGRGVVSQPLKPGWLYSILGRILPF